MPDSADPESALGTGSFGDAAHASARQEDLAFIAHEVRGALTVISGFAEIMRRPLSEADTRAALDGIGRAVRRIDRLLHDAMAEPAHPSDLARHVDLASLVEGVVAEQRAISGRIIEMQLDARPIITAAPEAIERALGNVIGNALKYSLTNSSVEVTVGQTTERAFVTVADRGPGIPAEERGRVMEPFQRLHDDETPGTGLGLTVVKGVAESHGGCVVIDERPGGGSLVTIELALG